MREKVKLQEEEMKDFAQSADGEVSSGKASLVTRSFRLRNEIARVGLAETLCTYVMMVRNHFFILCDSKQHLETKCCVCVGWNIWTWFVYRLIEGINESYDHACVLVHQIFHLCPQTRFVLTCLCLWIQPKEGSDSGPRGEGRQSHMFVCRCNRSHI